MSDPLQRNARRNIGRSRKGWPGRILKSPDGRRVVFVIVLLCTVAVLAALRWKVVREERAEHRLHTGPATSSSVPKADPRSADELFAASVAAYQNGQRETAFDLAESALETGEDPQLIGKIRNLRGIIHFEAGRHPEAIAEFLTAVRNDKKNAGYYFNWAEAMRAEGHSAAAVPPMRAAAELRPEDPLTRIKLHFLLIEAGQAEPIARDINRLSEDGGLNLDAAFVKAALLHLNGQQRESAELLAKLKNTAPAELYEICLKDRVFNKEVPSADPE